MKRLLIRTSPLGVALLGAALYALIHVHELTPLLVKGPDIHYSDRNAKHLLRSISWF